MQDHMQQCMNVIDLKFIRVSATDKLLSKLVTVENTFDTASYAMKDQMVRVDLI